MVKVLLLLARFEDGLQQPLLVSLRGDQDRLTLRTQAEEQRRGVAFEREHAAGLATRMARR